MICFDTLDTFGKDEVQMKNINRSFQLFLEDYVYDDIQLAFKDYMKRKTVMPKPADIIKIIDPPKKEFKPCPTTFIDIKRKIRENQFVTDAELKYCQDFIASRVSDDIGVVENTIKQVEYENKQYYLGG